MCFCTLFSSGAEEDIDECGSGWNPLWYVLGVIFTVLAFNKERTRLTILPCHTVFESKPALIHSMAARSAATRVGFKCLWKLNTGAWVCPRLSGPAVSLDINIASRRAKKRLYRTEKGICSHARMHSMSALIARWARCEGHAWLGRRPYHTHGGKIQDWYATCTDYPDWDRHWRGDLCINRCLSERQQVQRFLSM